MKTSISKMFLVSGLVAIALGCSESGSDLASFDISTSVAGMNPEIGAGYESHTGGFKQVCVDATISDTTLVGEQVTTTHRPLEIVTDIRGLREASWDISQEEFLRYAVGGAASDKTKKLEEHKYDKYSVYLYSAATSAVGSIQTTTVDFRSSIKDLIAEGDFARVYGRCGDRFVQKLVRGGELHAIIKIIPKSLEDKRSLEADLRRSLNQPEVNLDQIVGDRAIKKVVFVSGASSVFNQPGSIQDLRRTWDLFLRDVHLGGHQRIAAVVRSYDELEPSLSQSIFIEAGIDPNANRSSIRSLASALRDRQDVLWNLDYILEHRSQFSGLTRVGTEDVATFPYIARIRTEVQRQYDEILGLAERCLSDAVACKSISYAGAVLPSYVEPDPLTVP